MNMSTRGLNHSVTTGRTMCNGNRREDRRRTRRKGPRGASERASRAFVIVGPPVLGGARYLSWPPLPLSPPAPMDS